MNMYNVRLIEFGNGMLQIRRYFDPILINLMSDEQKDAKKELQMRTADAKLREDYDLCPFTNQLASVVKEFVEVATMLSLEELEKRRERSIRSSMSRTVNKLYEFSRANDWEWFLTFTFADEKMRYDYSTCCKSLSKWLDNMKQRYAPDLLYLVVPEHHVDGGWHFHGLFAQMGSIKMEIAKNQKKDSPYFGDDLRTSYPDGDYIYNLSRFSGGFTTATKINDSRRASSYIMKYVTKDLCAVTKNKHRYFHSKNLKEAVKSLYLLDDRDFDVMLDDYTISRNYTLGFKKEVNIDTESYTNKVTYYELG